MANKVQANNVNVMNAIRAQSTADFQSRIPVATEANITSVFDTMLSYAPDRNEFVNSLMTRIGLQTVDTGMFRNPLSMYKKDPIRYGATHEETYVNMAKGYEYDSQADFELAFQTYESYIQTVFHKVNLKMQYPVTVTYDNLRNAFLSETGIRDLVSAKMQSCISGAEYDEYTAMKKLIDTAYSKGLLPAESVAGTEGWKPVLAKIKEYVQKFRFPDPSNTILGTTATSEPSNLIFITTPYVNANISVEELAYAFNLSKAEVDVRTVIVDKFENSKLLGVLMDIRFFNCREQFREMTQQPLANALKWNYFYTLVEMVSASPFYPIVAITDESVEGLIPTLNSNTELKMGDNNLSEYITFNSVSEEDTYGDKRYLVNITSSTLTGKDAPYVIAGTPIIHVPSSAEGTIDVEITNMLGERLGTVSKLKVNQSTP